MDDADVVLVDEPRWNAQPKRESTTEKRGQEEDGSCHMAAASPDHGRRRFRIADEVFTIQSEAAFEKRPNRQGNGVDGHCTEPEGGERHRGGEGWINICTRAWTSDKQGTLCGEFKDDCEILGQPAYLEHVIHQRERKHEWLRLGTRGAAG